jgi:Ran GTPase-activating protein (RanGAP) involved in mRNA processing and transport
MLSGVLGQCSSLATLDLGYNNIGAEGAGSLAGVLGQCSSLATLDLEGNDIGDEGIAMIRMSIPDRVQLSV